MKNKDLQNVVLSKYQNGDTPTKIYHHLSSAIGLRTIKRWCQTGTINLSSSPDCPHLVRTKANINRVKDCSGRKSRVSARKIATELNISRISVWRILKNDIGLRSYNKIMEPSLSDDQRVKWKNLQIILRTNFRKENTIEILFSDEKYFDIDGVHNSHSGRVRAVNHVDADEKGAVNQIPTLK